MRRGAEMQPLGAYCFSKIANQIAMRSHLGCCPVGKPAVIHGESIMVLKDWHYIFRARIFKKMRPRSRIEFLRFKQRNKILVTEFILCAIHSNVMLVFRRARNIHVPRIPLVAESGYGINAPMNENAKLRILIPSRDLI